MSREAQAPGPIKPSDTEIICARYFRVVELVHTKHDFIRQRKLLDEEIREIDVEIGKLVFPKDLEALRQDAKTQAEKFQTAREETPPSG